MLSNLSSVTNKLYFTEEMNPIIQKRKENPP